MRALIVVLIFVAGLGATCTSAKAQQQQTFNLRFCNESGTVAYLALTVLTTPTMWRVKGWYAIDNQQCSDLGTYFGSTFYYFGTAADGTWQAAPTDSTSVQECILSDAFDYEAGKGPSCTADQAPHFALVTVTASGTFTVTLH